jgi:hypothetical protein
MRYGTLRSLRPNDIQTSIEYFERGYDMFEYESIQRDKFTIGKGKLPELESFIDKHSARAGITDMDAQNTMIKSRYFQIVPLDAVYENEPFAFIIMPFKPEELDQTIWTQVMKPTLEEKYPNVHFIRSDDVTEPGKIDSQIYTAISKAIAVIAEVTKPNANVYYELGMAHAMNKRVYMYAENKALELAFDTKTVRAEPYDSAEHLKTLIKERFEL